MKVKVTAHTFGSSLVEIFDTWSEAKRWMEMTDKSNIPHEYNDQIYTIYFEVFTLPDIAMSEEEFNELEELVNGKVEELPVEEVEE